MSFDTLKLHPAILKAVADSGYTTPTPIQAEAVPLVLEGHDLIASARTGTGKTAAFMLPALHRLAESQAAPAACPRVLVLTPTRELANQVNDAARRYGSHLRFRTASILGGMPYRLQLKQLSGRVDLIVATPGRLLDHLDRGRVDLSRVELLVLDEADRMLDMGFVDDVEKLAAATPAGRQTLLFTATLNPSLQRLAGRLLKEPRLLEMDSQVERNEAIEQRLYLADDLRHKNRLLSHLVESPELSKAIIFSATKRDCDLLAEELRTQGHDAAALHGDMNQAARNRTIARLRSGRLRLLVATDVAARGIDISGVSHVINYDIPRFAEDYVHRIGRTGRAGATGIAVSFVNPDEAVILKRIERYTGQTLPLLEIAGLEPTRSLRRQSSGRRQGQGDGPGRGKGGFHKGAARPGGDRPWHNRGERPRSRREGRPARA